MQCSYVELKRRANRLCACVIEGEGEKEREREREGARARVHSCAPERPSGRLPGRLPGLL